MPSPMREKALAWIDKNIPEGRQIKSNTLPGEFRQLTWMTHEQIMAQWQAWADNGKQGAFLTCCNAFVIQYCNFMGLPNTLVRWKANQIQATLAKLNKSYAWVDPKTQICPSAGDIMIGKHQHVGIALYSDLEGRFGEDFRVTGFTSVDGGQNHIAWVRAFDPEKNAWFTTNTIDTQNSFDRIKRVRHPDPHNDPPTGPYSGDNLQGWIDIDLFFYGPTGEPGTDDGGVASVWFNEEGDVVHPDAPDGAGGVGYFRTAGTLDDGALGQGLPHPWGPAARYLDPLAISRVRRDSNKG